MVTNPKDWILLCENLRSVSSHRHAHDDDLQRGPLADVLRRRDDPLRAGAASSAAEASAPQLVAPTGDFYKNRVLRKTEVQRAMSKNRLTWRSVRVDSMN